MRDDEPIRVRRVGADNEDHAPPPREDRRDGGGHDAEQPRKRRRILIVAAILLALAVGGYLLYRSLAGGSEQGGPGGPGGPGGGRPPATVTVTRAEQETWGEELTAVGTLEAIQGVEVTTERPGKVTAIRFASGERVRAGELLVELDTSIERAQLAAIEAQLAQAGAEANRAQRLIERGAIAEAQVEESTAQLGALRAQADEIRATIDDKQIEAPFAGELGLRQVDLGQYLNPGDPIASLQTLDPIYANFELPEGAIGQVRVGQRVALSVEAYPEQSFTGRIIAVEPAVSENTRTVRVQARLPNPGRRLRPGMFADVAVNLPGERTVTTLPATAVTFNPYGDAVFFVRPIEEARRERAQEPPPLGQRDEEGGGILSGLFGGIFAGLVGGGGDEQPEGQRSSPASGGGGGGEADAAGGAPGGQQQGQSGPPGQGGQQGQGGPPPPQFVAQRAFIETGERRGLMVEITRGVEPGQRVVTSGQLKLEDGAPIYISRQNILEGVPERPTEP